jgi:hypothetical protein
MLGRDTRSAAYYQSVSPTSRTSQSHSHQKDTPGLQQAISLGIPAGTVGGTLGPTSVLQGLEW